MINITYQYPVYVSEMNNDDFQYIPKIMYNELFSTVWKTLSANKCIAVFPEGGSHDQSNISISFHSINRSFLITFLAL